jgi:hypothetical protein
MRIQRLSDLPQTCVCGRSPIGSVNADELRRYDAPKSGASTANCEKYRRDPFRRKLSLSPREREGVAEASLQTAGWARTHCGDFGQASQAPSRRSGRRRCLKGEVTLFVQIHNRDLGPLITVRVRAIRKRAVTRKVPAVQRCSQVPENCSNQCQPADSVVVYPGPLALVASARFLSILRRKREGSLACSCG